MKRALRIRRPSAAMLVATTALFIALGGTGYAAFSLPKNSVGTKQLKKGAVTTKKIKNGAVTAKKINASGLTVPNATHADTAGSATTASSASHASSADNANDLGGSSAGSYRNEWALVNADGSVAASSGSITVSHPFPGGYYVKFPNSALNHGLAATPLWQTTSEEFTARTVICDNTGQGHICNPPFFIDSTEVYVELKDSSTSTLARTTGSISS